VALALYRKYRPARFADVIGQEHVTDPLQQALRNDRVNHAYLFSGPRGCGKTSSARILARSLNCEQGPTPDPCGVCESCVGLAANGPGTLDVIELDAASHGGVDDTRELRERAMYAPVQSRYKIYIIDEAHMVTTQGFNALLKLVEEPPDYIRFIFATTEPDKVLQTIRSRTHHYPFRLVPPATLLAHLERISAEEGIAVEPGVLPLVVRAGQGSVRDALSVLDQLAGSAGTSGLTYERAASLLGYTPSELLHQVVEAVAAQDAPSLFAAIDAALDRGLEPWRFSGDLLDRLRDLLLLAQVDDAAERGLVHVPADELPAMRAQAAALGVAGLVRAADLVAATMNERRTTSAPPRLLLELLAARLVLPRASDDPVALAARLSRLESGLAAGGPAMTASPVRPAAAPAAAPATAAQAESAAPAAPAPAAAPEPPGGPTPAAEGPPSEAPEPPPAGPPAPEPLAPAPVAAPAVSGAPDVASVRQLWPHVLESIKAKRRVTWMLLYEKASVLSLESGVLTLGLPDAGTARGFLAGDHPDVVHAALLDVVGVEARIDAVPHGAAPTPSGGGAPDSSRAAPAPAEQAPAEAASPSKAAEARQRAEALAREEAERVAAPDEPAPDDADADDSGKSGGALIADVLGGRQIGSADG
jgi:DNA polymerase-3 subunit gamma/tau